MKNATDMYIQPELTYKRVDNWLGEQSVNVFTAHKRLKWSLIYVGDAWVEVFNHYQIKVFGRRNQWVSRIVAAGVILVPLALMVFNCPLMP